MYNSQSRICEPRAHGAKDFMETTKIAVFKGRQVRKTLHNNEWWFSITDVIEALTDSTDPKQYIKKMRQREPELDSYWGTICTPLELPAPDGKIRATNTPARLAGQ